MPPFQYNYVLLINNDPYNIATRLRYLYVALLLVINKKHNSN